MLTDGFQIDVMNAQKVRVPDSLDAYSGIVILGGPMAVYDDLPYLAREQDLIRKAMKSKIPILGICLGSQLIAQAAGGRVFKGSKKEIGWYDVSLSEAGRSDVFRGVDEGRILRVFQWHGDTYDLPKGAVILASSDTYPQAFRSGSAIGIQFHLEVDEKMIRRWIKEYNKEILAEGIGEQEILPRSGYLESLARNCAAVYKNFVRELRAR